MSAMEQSLRRALEGGDAGDPAFREAIYSASERALERMLAQRGTGEEAAQLQRIRLAETINRVEEDYFAALTGEPGDEGLPGHQSEAVDAWPGEEDFHADPVTALGPDRTHDDPEEGAREPVGADAPGRLEEPADAVHPAGSDGLSPVLRAPGADRPDPEMGRRAPRAPVSLAEDDARLRSPERERREAEDARARKGRLRPFGFGLAALLLVLGLGVSLYASLVGPLPLLGSVSGGASGGSGSAATMEAADWILLFDGTRLEAIATPNGGRVAAVAGAGGRPAVRIAAAAEGGEIAVQVGAGVVGAIRGRTLRVEIVAGSPDGRSREFGVRCPFGGDTACGRQRFNTVQSSEAFVFDMHVPASAPTTGTIAVEPGLGGTTGRDLDLYSVRLRPVAG